MMTRSSLKAGFSLAEIMIAILIIGLISAAVIPAINKMREDSKKATTRSNLKALKSAVDTYVEELEGNYPESLQDLIKKPASLTPELLEKWEPFLQQKKIPMDGWGRPFVYKRTEGQENEYELYSHGSTSGKKGKIDAWDL
jgi:general secretion pathway protein G